MKRSNTIPAILLIYLAVMAYLGLKGLRTGQTSLFAYIATIVVTLGVIFLLRKFLQRQERLRQERLDDMNNNNKTT